MKKFNKALSLILALLMVAGILPMAVFAEDVIPEGYIGIYSAEALSAISKNPTSNYILMSDIDLTNYTKSGGIMDFDGHGWKPLGGNGAAKFSGIFDGNGKTITGLRIENAAGDYIGLFGETVGIIKNLTIKDANIVSASSNLSVGVVAGCSSGNINNVNVIKSSVISKSQYTGGIVGLYDGAKISNSSVSGAVIQVYEPGGENSSAFAGGIVGKVLGTSTIENCANNAAVSGKIIVKSSVKAVTSNQYAGGISAYMSSNDSKVVKCYNMGDVTANSTATVEGETIIDAKSVSYAGGILGYSNVAVENCYNDGKITSETVPTTKNGNKVNETYVSGIAGLSGGKVSYSMNFGSLIGTGGTPVVSGISYGENEKCYYLYGTAENGKYNTDDVTTILIFTETISKKSAYQYLDFDKTWFIDSRYEMKHPQLLSNFDTKYHTHDMVTSVVKPGCEEKGYTKDECKYCKYMISYNETDATGHTPGEEPSCTEPQLCITCKKQLKPAKGHTPGAAATCTTPQICLVCTGTVTPALGHNTVEEDIPSTCQTRGYTLEKCTRCDYTKKKDIKELGGHTSDGGKVQLEATCDRAGIMVYTCTVCKNVFKTEEIAKKEHTKDDGTVTTPATCTNTGLKSFKCKYCKMDMGTEIIPVTGHKKDKGTIIAAPTATVTGVMVYKCEYCKIELSREIIPVVRPMVNDVKLKETTIYYQKTGVLTPEISADEGAVYTVTYTSADENIVKVDANGNLYGVAKGSTTVKCVVTDSFNNTIEREVKVNVTYSLIQWIIRIINFLMTLLNK